MTAKATGPEGLKARRALQRVVATVAFTAIACGGGDDGDGNGSPPDGNDDGVECGDGTCTDGLESFGSCPEDCPPVVNCGNGACDGDESCALCAQDCGECPVSCGDGACNGNETCSSCSQDCGCGEDQVCREDACAPISTNPLIESMPGEWISVEPDPGVVVTIAVDPSQPDCGDPKQVPGDACVVGIADSVLVLSGTRLFVDVPTIRIEGQVLNDGTRVEYDYLIPARAEHYVLEKQP